MSSPPPALVDANGIPFAVVADHVHRWEDQKRRYNEELNALLAQKRKGFEALFSDYYDKLRGIAGRCGFGEDIEADILQTEYIRMEGLRTQLFGNHARESSLGIVEKKLAERSDLIKLNSAMVVFQSLARGFLQRKQLKKLASKSITRKRVIAEIIETEKSYVRSLETMLKYFYEPLKQHCDMLGDNLLSLRDLQLLFSDIQLILPLNKELLQRLQAVDVSSESDPALGNVFIALAPMFKLYTQYINNYDGIMKTLQRLQKNSKFSAFLQNQSQIPEVNKLSLSSFQIMPIQRVPRYQLLLTELLKFTPPSTEASSSLEKALVTIISIAKFIDESKRQVESGGRIFEIQQIFSGPRYPTILEPHRKYVMEGDFELRVQGGRNFRAWIVLFSDSLLIAERLVSPQSHISEWASLMVRREVEFVELISLNGASIERHQETDRVGLLAVFKDKDQEKPYRMLFYPETLVGKDDLPNRWVAAAQEQIANLKKGKRASLSVLNHRLDEAPSSPDAAKRRDSLTPSSALLKKHFLVPAAHLESVRSASYQTYLEAHQLWIRSGESVEPKVLLPIAEKLEAVSSQLSQVLRLPSLNSDEIALQKDQLNALLEEGRKSIGDFKIMIMEQYPAQREGSAAPRQAMAALLKWYLRLEQQSRELMDKIPFKSSPPPSDASTSPSLPPSSPST